jgi:hypothetical protein
MFNLGLRCRYLFNIIPRQLYSQRRYEYVGNPEEAPEPVWKILR